jgi:hypothetical protein
MKSMFPVGTTHTLQITGNKVEILVHIPGKKSYVEVSSLEVQQYFGCGLAFTEMEKMLKPVSRKANQNAHAINPKPNFSNKRLQQPTQLPTSQTRKKI